MPVQAPVLSPFPVEGSVLRRVARMRGGEHRSVEDQVAEEVPVAFICNGAPFAVMMATPADLVDFAIGFALAEGLAARADTIQVERIEHLVEGIELHLRVPDAPAASALRRARSLAGPGGCGLCGSHLLDDVARSPAAVEAEVRIPVDALHRALHALAAAQPLNALTGATHAAGWAWPDGRLQLVREDVGRHNALDKLVGAMQCAGVDVGDGFLVVTSRASYEMALKAASAGIALMAAVSAPTALAISLAERVNLTLIGFAREDGYAVYSHPRRLVAAAPPVPGASA